jgi:uncharacterized UPF0160 family protein
MSKTIATHNAKFHTDDVFAVATLLLSLGKDNCKIIRTRDEKLISEADIVVDVGGVHNADKDRFDHHQLGGAGKRENGIEYASFGLVWQKYGRTICKSEKVAEEVDRILVQAVDAVDNGMNLTSPIIAGVHQFDINSVINLYRPTWREDQDWDKYFFECVEWAQMLLSRLIKQCEDAEVGAEAVRGSYESAQDKKIIFIGKDYDVGREIIMGVLSQFPEPIYAVLYRSDTKNWQVLAIRKNQDTFESRKPLPQSWRGLRDAELVKESCVDGALFCHRSGFMCLAHTEVGAIELAQKALNA